MDMHSYMSILLYVCLYHGQLWCSIGCNLSTKIAGVHKCYDNIWGFNLTRALYEKTVLQCNCQMFVREGIHQQFPLKHSHGLHPDHVLISGLFLSCQNTAWLDIWAKRRPSAHHHHPSSFCASPSASNVCQREQRQLERYSYSWVVSRVSTTKQSIKKGK